MDRAPTSIRFVESSGSHSQTQTEIITEATDSGGSANTQAPVLRLRLQKPKSGRKVSWTSETIDNEELNKKKSKCCCVYHKPLEFGESSSESEDDCEHCSGHVEKRKKKKSHSHDATNHSDCSSSDNACSSLKEESPSSTTNPI